MDTRLKIHEIFYSIQGEGKQTGTPALFIRLAGCNLHCPWCDTDYETKVEMTLTEIRQEIVCTLQAVSNWSGIIFVITGGEPTIQNIHPLITMLRENFPDNKIYIETNGTNLKKLANTPGVWLTVSPKFESYNYTALLEDPKWSGDELKVVLGPNVDMKMLADLPKKLNTRFGNYFVQPCSGNNGPAIQFVKENPSWRLSLQTQKLVNIQ